MAADRQLVGDGPHLGRAAPGRDDPGADEARDDERGGDGPDPDQWDGYPAERDAILEAFGDAGDVVVLSGDVHIGLAMDLPRDRHDDRAVAVEFVTTSLTSQNVDDKMGWEPRTGACRWSVRGWMPSRT